MSRPSRRTVLTSLAAGVVSLTAGCSTTRTAGSGLTAGDDWPMHYHDERGHSRADGLSPLEERPETVETLEATEERRYGNLYPSPVVSGSRAYVGGDGLFVIDLESFEPESVWFDDETVFGAAVVGGTMYVSSRSDSSTLLVRAVATATGEVEWEYATSEDGIRSLPPTVTSEYVYLSIGSGTELRQTPTEHRLLALEREGGSEAWTRSRPGETESPSPAAVADGTVYSAGGTDGRTEGFGPDCGIRCTAGIRSPDRTWESEVPVASHTIPVVLENSVVFGEQHALPRGGSRGGGHLRAFDRESGSLEWEHELGYHVTAPAVDADRNRLLTGARWENDDDHDRAVPTDAAVYAHEYDGTEVWRTDLLDRAVEGSPVIVGDLVYVGTRPSWAVDDVSKIHAFDLESGAERWHIDVPVIPAVVVPADEQVLAASWHGTVVSVGR